MNVRASLVLHSHPLASFCQKVLIALYEAGTPFEHRMVDLGDEVSKDAFLKLNPTGKMPALEDLPRRQVMVESSVIIEYLDRHQPGDAPMIPTDFEAALEVRAQDRFFDLYVADPMQRIVFDRLRPNASSDAFGVEQAKAELSRAYDILQARMAGREWAAGDTFSLADCAAAPALFYADWVAPIGEAHTGVRAYLDRLLARPSFARVVAEAEPFHPLFPKAGD